MKRAQNLASTYYYRNHFVKKMKFALVISAVLLGVGPYTFVSASVEMIGESSWALSDELMKTANEIVKRLAAIGADTTQKIAGYSSQINDIKKTSVRDLENPNNAECKTPIHTLYNVSMDIVRIAKECVSAKVATAVKHRTEISRVYNEITAGLKNFESKYRECSSKQGAFGLGSIIKAPHCLGLGAQAIAYYAKKRPEISWHRAKLVAVIATLPVSIPYCTIETGLSALPGNIRKVFSGVRGCTIDFITNVHKLVNNLRGNVVSAAPELSHKVNEICYNIPEIHRLIRKKVQDEVLFDKQNECWKNQLNESKDTSSQSVTTTSTSNTNVYKQLAKCSIFAREGANHGVLLPMSVFIYQVVSPGYNTSCQTHLEMTTDTRSPLVAETILNSGVGSSLLQYHKCVEGTGFKTSLDFFCSQ